MPRSASQATERVLRLTAAVWSLAWLITLLVAYLPDPAIVTVPWLTTSSLAALGAALVGLTFLRLQAWIFVTVVVATSLLAAGTVQVPDLSSHLLFLTTWLNLGAIVSALLLKGRSAPIAIVALAATALAILSFRLATTDDTGHATSSALMAFAYCIAVGMAVNTASVVVREAARFADAEGERARLITQEQVAHAAHRDETERMSRLLHDTCINTLGAIRAGAGTRQPDAVRARCSDDLARLELSEIDDVSSPSIAELASDAQVQGQRLGLEVETQVVGDRNSLLSARTWHAARGALREALLNVTKHVPKARADVRVSLNGAQLSVEVRDPGPGWSGKFEPGRGIDRSIRQRVESSGGTVVITSQPESGTCVSMGWANALVGGGSVVPVSDVGESGAVAVTDPELAQRLGLRRVALGAGAWMLGYGVVATLVFAGATPIWGALVALVIMSLSLLLVRKSKEVNLPRIVSPLLALGIALVVALPGNDGTCLTTNPAAWGPDGAAVLAVIACMLGASAWFPASAIIGFSIGLFGPLAIMAGPSVECAEASATVLLIEVGAVLAVAAFRRLLLRTWASAVRSRDIARAAESVLTESAARHRARSSRLAWTVGDAGDLLRRIADGTADPSRPDVIDNAGRIEEALRSLITLDSALGRLGDALAEQVAAALDSGRKVVARSGGPVLEPTLEQISDLRELLACLIAEAPTPADLQVTLFSLADGGSLTIVAPAGSDTRPQQKTYDSGLSVTVQVLDDEQLVTVRWPGV